MDLRGRAQGRQAGSMQELKMPPASHFLLAAAGIKDGANQPGDEWVGSVSLKHIYEIAKVGAETVCRVKEQLSDQPASCIKSQASW